MCVCLRDCARARARGRRGTPGKEKKKSRRSNYVKIISPWLYEWSLQGKAILGIKNKKIFKEAWRKAGQEGAGHSGGHVPPRRHLFFSCTGLGRPPSLTTHLPAAPCCPGARTAQQEGLAAGRGGAAKVWRRGLI